MAPKTHAERLAALETLVPVFQADLAEIKADVKTLLAAHNRQSGMARLGMIVWSGLVAIGGAVAGAFLARPHS